MRSRRLCNSVILLLELDIILTQERLCQELWHKIQMLYFHNISHEIEQLVRPAICSDPLSASDPLTRSSRWGHSPRPPPCSPNACYSPKPIGCLDKTMRLPNRELVARTLTTEGRRAVDTLMEDRVITLG